MSHCNCLQSKPCQFQGQQKEFQHTNRLCNVSEANHKGHNIVRDNPQESTPMKENKHTNTKIYKIRQQIKEKLYISEDISDQTLLQKLQKQILDLSDNLQTSESIDDKEDQKQIQKTQENPTSLISLKNNFIIELKLQLLGNLQRISSKYSNNSRSQEISRKARQLRKICIQKKVTQEQKQGWFDRQFERLIQDFTKSIDHRSNSQQIFKNLNLYYNLSMRQKFKILLSQLKFDETHLNYSYGQLFEKTQQKMIKQRQQISWIQHDQNPPVIILDNETTSLKLKYFNMKEFFKGSQTKLSYYMPNMRISQLINYKQIQNEIKFVMERHELLNNFVKLLAKDLQKLFVKLKQGQFIKEVIRTFEQLKSSYDLGQIWVNRNLYQINNQTKAIEKIQKCGTQTNWQKIDSQFLLITAREISSILKIKQKWESWRMYPTSVIILQLIRKKVLWFVYSQSKTYQEQKDQILTQISNKITQQLKTIGINLVDFKIKAQQYQLRLSDYKTINKPIKIQKLPQLHEKINKLSKYFYPQNITVMREKSDCAVQMAYSKQSQRLIKEIVQYYKDKKQQQFIKQVNNSEFVKFAQRHVNYKRVFDQVRTTIEKLPQNTNLQQAIEAIYLTLNTEIGYFNDDLRQICHKLSFNFINDIHTLCKKLIWKKIQIEKKKQCQKKENQIKEDKKNQEDIFYRILNTDSRANCLIESENFARSYKNYLVNLITKNKQKFSNERATQFINFYSRKQIQQIVDKQISQSQDVNYIYQYLKNPDTTIKEKYNFYLSSEASDLQKLFTNNQQIEALKDIISIIKKTAEIYQGLDQDWDSDSLFVTGTANQSLLVKEIFIQLLLNGTPISSTYEKEGKNNYYALNESVIFKIDTKNNNEINQVFLKQINNFEISNISIFLRALQKQLEKINLENYRKFSEEQLTNFKNKAQLILCPSRCPCCQRLCDIDMRINSTHSQHRCDSGHQMRAVKGIRVIKNDETQYYAQVLRCQDIQPKMIFSFNGRSYLWQQFVQEQKKSWCLQFNKGEDSDFKKQLFRHIWNLCGRKICEQYTKAGKQMKYIQYQEGYLLSKYKKHQNWQYIFAIDGSGSMGGNSWDQQLIELKKILSDIGQNAYNTASVLVFNCDVLPFCIKKDPTLINVNQIKFPSGGTTPNPTFLKAADIGYMPDSKNQLKSVHFFYISDGSGDHPSSGINKLLELKDHLYKKKLSFKYTSILIGEDDDGRQCMQRINQEMGGNSLYVNNASDISGMVKQFLN